MIPGALFLSSCRIFCTCDASNPRLVMGDFDTAAGASSSDLLAVRADDADVEIRRPVPLHILELLDVLEHLLGL